MPSRTRSSFPSALAVALALVVPACTERAADPGLPDVGPIELDAGADAGGSGPSDAGPRPDAGPRLDDVLIYAHSRDTLYTFSPYTETVAAIGPFRFADGSDGPFMLDLAVDAGGQVYTSSDASLYRVDPSTATITEVGAFGLARSEQLFALTFLVPGTIAPEETLIGATNEGVYYRIDLATARATRLGSYPDGWSSSGDLVSIEGLGTFATLRRSDHPTDVLARIDFRAGGASDVTVLGATGYTQLFGLGYWGRSLYGFSNRGELVEIDRATGAGTIATPDTGTMQFWGAGVTTRAPVLF